MSDEESGIERLRKRLYSRDSRVKGVGMGTRRRRLRENYYDVKESWPLPKEKEVPFTRKNRRSFLVILLVVSVIFFAAALGISAYLFFGEGYIVSSENIDIKITGPTQIAGGEELVLQIAVTNRNTVSAESASLIVEFPEGARSPDLTAELPRIREALGDIAPGGRVNKTIRAAIFGKENSVADIAIVVEYRTEGSSATFFKEQEYKVVLSSSPLTLIVDALEEMISGQEAVFKVEIVSNSTAVIKDVLFKAEYPFGFNMLSAVPEPSFGENVWRLGDIPPEGKQTVTIRGTLEGQDNEERIMRFQAGIQSDKNTQEISAAFGAADFTTVIKRPFISVNLALNGNTSPEFVASRGREIRADMTWQNNLPTQISDVEIAATLAGAILDKASVSASRGFYNSLDNTIVWSKETDSQFGVVNPGSSGRASFTFAPLSLSSGTSFRNPKIFLDISVKGKRLGERQVPEEIQSTLSREIRIATDLLLASRAVYTVGPFDNRGPLPPRAEQETTYTIIWTVTNSSNSVSDVAVLAMLPSYIQWLGVVSPASEDVNFNPVGGTVEWNIGDLPAGAGSGGTAREIAFQIAFVPSIGQIGSSPAIVNDQTVSGTDNFTATRVGSTNRALSTRLSTDPGVPNSHASVVP